MPKTTFIKTNSSLFSHILHNGIIPLLLIIRILKLNPSHFQVIIIITIHHVNTINPFNPSKVTIPIQIPHIIFRRKSENRTSRVTLVQITVGNSTDGVSHVDKHLSSGVVQDCVRVLPKQRERELDFSEFIFGAS